MRKRMDYEMAKGFADCVERIHREAEDKVRKCRNAYNLIEKMKPLLPKNWGIEYEQWGTLTFMRTQQEKDPITGEEIKHSPIEFRTVCNHVERIIGKQMFREFKDWSIPQLRASVWDETNEIYIYVQLGAPNCEITYQEEEVPAHTKRTAVVPDACLGKQAS